MPCVSIRNPYLIIVVCLALAVIGITSVVRMPVDLFPAVHLREVVMATSYSSMPAEDIGTDVTNPLKRFFTMASGMDHMDSRAIIGGLTSSALPLIFIVPAAYLLVYRRRRQHAIPAE